MCMVSRPYSIATVCRTTYEAILPDRFDEVSVGYPFCDKQIDQRGSNEKICKIRSKGVVKVLRDLLLEFLDALYISATVEARNFKFGMQIDCVVLTKKKLKLGQMWS